MPRGKGCHAVISASRGATRIGFFFVPGLEGTAAYLLALILGLKGYKIKGVQGLDMPANWFLLHWGLHPRNTEAISLRARAKCDAFLETVFKGHRAWDDIIALLLGIALIPVSLGYIVIARLFMAKTLFAASSCNGCGLCARSCPVGAIRMLGKKQSARPYWTFDCESCMRCIAYCPSRSIVPGQLWTGLALWLLLTFAAGLILTPLRQYFPVAAEFYDRNAAWTHLLLYPWIFLCLGGLYAVFNQLVRIKPLNFIFTALNLSRYWRYYREPATSVSDLTSEWPSSGKK
jgi:Pyruvate/2-oxoacid:ferredoxin oxidoreductase delta subunit